MRYGIRECDIGILSLYLGDFCSTGGLLLVAFLFCWCFLFYLFGLGLGLHLKVFAFLCSFRSSWDV